MKKIIFYIPIIVCAFSCENPTTIKVNDSVPAQGDSMQKDANVVSKKFVGQTFFNKSSDSFGQTTQQFSFDNNGKGTFYLAWTVGSKFYEQNGDLNWVIEDGKVYVRYLYLASDGVSSNEEEGFLFNEETNELIDENNNINIFKSLSKEKNQTVDDSPIETDYNRQQEQAEYESSQAYYNSENEKEKLETKSKIKEKVKLNQTQWQYYFIGEFESGGLPVYAMFTREGNRIYGKYLWCTISEAISIDGEIRTDNHFILQDASGNKFSGILKGESMSGKWFNSKYENTLNIRATTDNAEKSRTSKIVNSNQGCYTE
jgi:hypothetical protein